MNKLLILQVLIELKPFDDGNRDTAILATSPDTAAQLNTGERACWQRIVAAYGRPNFTAEERTVVDGCLGCKIGECDACGQIAPLRRSDAPGCSGMFCADDFGCRNG